MSELNRPILNLGNLKRIEDFFKPPELSVSEPVVSKHSAIVSNMPGSSKMCSIDDLENSNLSDSSFSVNQFLEISATDPGQEYPSESQMFYHEDLLNVDLI